MHDIDRTLAELEAEDDADLLSEEDPDDALDELEFDEEDEDDAETLLSDDEELELAAELVDVVDDEELEQFLGKLVRRVGRGIRRLGSRRPRLFKGGVVRRLGRALRKTAKRVLPLGGTIAGGVFGGPAGAMVGRGLASSVSDVFGKELEGLAPQDQELEAARRFVRLAAAATTNAARGSQTTASPERIVRASLEKAAQRHAPGLLRPMPASGRQSERRRPAERRASGRWFRRGKTIVLEGV